MDHETWDSEHDAGPSALPPSPSDPKSATSGADGIGPVLADSDSGEPSASSDSNIVDVRVPSRPPPPHQRPGGDVRTLSGLGKALQESIDNLGEMVAPSHAEREIFRLGMAGIGTTVEEAIEVRSTLASAQIIETMMALLAEQLGALDYRQGVIEDRLRAIWDRLDAVDRRLGAISTAPAAVPPRPAGRWRRSTLKVREIADDSEIAPPPDPCQAARGRHFRGSSDVSPSPSASEA